MGVLCFFFLELVIQLFIAGKDRKEVFPINTHTYFHKCLSSTNFDLRK